MADKKRICYKNRLRTHDPKTFKGIIEGRMNVEKYLEKREVKLGVDGISSHNNEKIE